MPTESAEPTMSDRVELADGITERTVRIEGGAGALAGVLTETTRSGPLARPVLIVHGWSTYRIGPHRLLVQMAREMAASGAPSLRFDLGGRGESDGEYMEAGLDEMIADTTACSGWLCERYGVGSVATFGMCAGGNVAAAAVALGAPIAQLVAVGMLPYQNEKTGVERSARARGMRRAFFAKLFNAESWEKLLTGRVRWRRVLGNLSGRESEAPSRDSGGEGRNLKDSVHDIPAALAKYQGNILFIFGGADDEGAAAREHFERFAERNRLDAYFHVVEGANHNFYSAEWSRELIDRALDFFAIERDGLGEDRGRT